jgi:TonB family protein
MSNSQWRRETVLPNSRRIELAGPTRRWMLDSSNDLPDPAKRVADIMQVPPRTFDKLMFESVEDHPQSNPPSQCIISKQGARHEKFAFCFEKRAGALVRAVLPEIRPTYVLDYSCLYGQFRRLGNSWFPGHINCFHDRHLDLDIVVAELAAESSSPDPSLFTPPVGAIELDNCSTALVPPKAISNPPPFHAFGPTDPGWVKVEVVVDAKGKPQNARISRSGGKRFDVAALTAIRGWRFKPATCNGQAVPTQIDVEFHFGRHL